MFKAAPDSLGHVRGGLDIVALYIDDSDRNVHSLSDSRNQFKLRKFAARHLDVHLVTMKVQERREHRGKLARPYRSPLVIPKTKMGADSRLASHWFDSSIEQIHKAKRVFLMRVATHRRLVDADFTATRARQILEFLSHHGQQRLGQRPTVGVLPIRFQPAA